MTDDKKSKKARKRKSAPVIGTDADAKPAPSPAIDVAAEAGEEVGELLRSQRFEQNFFAAGEQAIQRGTRDTRFGGDVVDGHLGKAPLLAAGLGRVEDAPFEGETGVRHFLRQ